MCKGLARLGLPHTASWVQPHGSCLGRSTGLPRATSRLRAQARSRGGRIKTARGPAGFAYSLLGACRREGAWPFEKRTGALGGLASCHQSMALPGGAPAREFLESLVPVQPNDHAWLQPGATAYVRFGHLEGDDGWYECTLGEQEGGADPGGNQPPRHRARRHRRWPGNSTPSNGRGCRDDVASIAWGARHLISTQAPGA